MILRFILAQIGFVATVGQIVLLRELLVVFHGNEMSLGVILANWLIWIAFGSALLGRTAGKWQRPDLVLAGLQLLSSTALPLTIFSTRLVRVLCGAVPGEILGPGALVVASFLLLSVFCSISGTMFAVGSRLYSLSSKVSTARATSAVYLLETIGSAIGGLLVSFVMLHNLSSFQIVLTLSLLNLMGAIVLTYPKVLGRLLFWVGTVTTAFLLIVYGAPYLDSLSFPFLWGDLRVLETRDSQYGNLVVTETEGSRSLYVNGLVSLTTPDPEAAEEAVHFALLQHPSPERLLLIGGGLNGSLAQALQHKSLEQIDYVELDPTMFDLAHHFLGSGYRALEQEPRVSIHQTDGRLFLRKSSKSYDVIVVNLPDPQTAQLNRFYTREFFQESLRRLSDDGLLSFSVSGTENYISDELAALLSCLHRTLRSVFTNVLVFPGGKIHFFATQRPALLSTDPEILMERLRSRSIQTEYVREYYLPFRLMPDRLQDLERQLMSQNDGRINTDFAPLAYYLDILLWSTRFHTSYRWLLGRIGQINFLTLLSSILAISLALAGWQWLRRGTESLTRRAAGSCVWAMGFTLLALEILLLLGFQAVYGYVYYQLALIISAFMLGMAAGSWQSLNRKSPDNPQRVVKNQTLLLAWLQLAAAISALMVCGFLYVLAEIDSGTVLRFASTFGFPLLAILCGFLGGFQFPLATQLYFGLQRSGPVNPGLLYGIDILGAWGASIALSVIVLPVFGLFQSAVLIAAVNSGPIVLAAAAAVRREE